mgnify:CR=1 FL=1
MNLIEIYETAIVSKDYSVFKSAIDKQMNGTPETVISTNEFKLINIALGDISKSFNCGADEKELRCSEQCMGCAGLQELDEQ